MKFDLERVLLNVRGAATEDLLNRITAFRAGMEPEAIPLIEAELRERGVSRQVIDAHEARCLEECIVLEDGIAAKCSFCQQPAVARGWDWHRVFGILPVIPRSFYFCRDHEPRSSETGG